MIIFTLGGYIKINVGSKTSNNDDGYLIAKIEDIEEFPNKNYVFCGKKCNYQLLVEHANYKKNFHFSVVSNQKFAEFEFNLWRTRMDKVYIILEYIYLGEYRITYR